MSRPRIGDIIEIQTSKGFVYAQYTHQHSRFGALIRVFDEVFEATPTDWEGIVNTDVRFSTFFPVAAAVDQGLVKIASSGDIAPENRSFPLFRDGVADPKTKKVATWWLWDGEKEWKVGRLTPEYKKLPIRGIWNHTLLVQRIEEGWRPELDVE